MNLLEGGKKGMEHLQTVARLRIGTPGWWTTVWGASTYF